jgi:hypothetical protein
MSSCENTDNGLGNELTHPAAYTTLIDTCTVSLTTIKIDSLQTSGKGIIIAGALSNEDLGKITLKNYLSFNLPTYYESRKEDTTPLKFDSITYEMYYSGAFTGDTTTLQTLRLHNLIDQLVLPESGSFYNTSSVPYDENIFAEKTFTPYPNRGEVVSIRLPDEIGQEMLDKISTGSDEFSSTEKFKRYFPGIAITSSQTHENAIFNYLANDSSAVIKIYYHFIEEHKDEMELTITAETSSGFYAVNHDYSSTPYKDLTRGYEGLKAKNAGNQSYLLGLIGLYTRIDFPYLSSLLELSSAGSVQQATLTIRPVIHTYNEQNPLPEQVQIYIADNTNSTIDAITTEYGSDMQTGNLTIDEDFMVDTYYVFTITDFIRSQIDAIGVNKQNLLLTLPDNDMNGSLKSLIIGNSHHSTEPIKLQIIYNIYD